jgi:hypothetical protein
MDSDLAAQSNSKCCLAVGNDFIKLGFAWGFVSSLIVKRQIPSTASAPCRCCHDFIVAKRAYIPFRKLHLSIPWTGGVQYSNSIILLFLSASVIKITKYRYKWYNRISLDDLFGVSQRPPALPGGLSLSDLRNGFLFKEKTVEDRE